MDALRKLAVKALEGVGDATLGEWGEKGEKAYHLRRRLTPKEVKITGDMLDIRGTAEGERRFEAVRNFIPSQMREWCRTELKPVTTS